MRVKQLVFALGVAWIASCGGEGAYSPSPPEPSTVMGSVTSPERGPLGGVTVTATALTSAPRSRVTAVTDAQTGRYEVQLTEFVTYRFALSGLPDGCVDPGAEDFYSGSHMFTGVLYFQVTCTPLPDA